MKIAPNILQMALAAILARNPDAVRSISQNIKNRIARKNIPVIE
jgi:hypothetical protein